MPGDVGLERELMQQCLAKGVDGLDLQSAGRFQRLGKEPPCLGKLEEIRLLALDIGDAPLQLLVRHRRPGR